MELFAHLYQKNAHKLLLEQPPLLKIFLTEFGTPFLYLLFVVALFAITDCKVHHSVIKFPVEFSLLAVIEIKSALCRTGHAKGLQT